MDFKFWWKLHALIKSNEEGMLSRFVSTELGDVTSDSSIVQCRLKYKIFAGLDATIDGD